MRDRAFDTKRLYRGVATGVIEGGMGALRLGGRLAASGARSIAQGAGAGDTFDIAGIVGQEFAISKGMRAVAIEARQAGQGWAGLNEATGKAKIRAVAGAYGGLKWDDCTFTIVDVTASSLPWRRRTDACTTSST